VTGTKLFFRFVVVISILLSITCCPAWAIDSCEDLRITVVRLGFEPDPINTIKGLHSCGPKAVPLLVAQLRVIDPEICNDEWQHQVWVERALRSITGQYFKFVSSQKLSPRLLRYREQSARLGLVMEWMSRGEIFMAPQDVQENVIETWKAWLDKNGPSFAVCPYEPYGDWYF
jgi:hypothetical protein